MTQTDNKKVQRVFKELNHWGVPKDAMLLILGLTGQAKPRDITKFQSGMKKLPETEECAAAQDHVLGIADALFTSFPAQEDYAASWMAQKNGKLANRTPLQCIIQDGVRGLVKVRATLDCAWAWDQDQRLNSVWQKTG